MLDDATIVQLQYFRTVVRLGSLTQAAEALSVTQPTLSTAIARLERQYRIQLLARIPRKGVEATLAGHRLLAALEPLLDSVGRLGSIARGSDDPRRGELSVGIYAPLAPFYSSTILLEAARLMPGVTLTMTEGNLDELPEALRRRQLDVALMYADELTPEFGITPLRTIPPHVVVAEDHRLVRAGRTSVSLHELADEPAAFLSIPQSFKRYISYFRALEHHAEHQVHLDQLRGDPLLRRVRARIRAAAPRTPDTPDALRPEPGPAADRGRRHALAAVRGDPHVGPAPGTHGDA